MRPSVATGLLLALGACASSQTPSSSVPDMVAPTTQRIVNPVASSQTIGGMTVASSGIGVEVAAAPDAVFAALQAVYKDLGITVTDLDATSRSIGNQSFRTRRKLGGVPMQTVLDCGNGSGGPNAETYDISVNLISYVQAKGASASTLVTRLSGVGNDPAFGRGNGVQCNTLGEFEKKIEAAVRAKLPK
jgi:hypothetical protein